MIKHSNTTSLGSCFWVKVTVYTVYLQKSPFCIHARSFSDRHLLAETFPILPSIGEIYALTFFLVGLFCLALVNLLSERIRVPFIYHNLVQITVSSRPK